MLQSMRRYPVRAAMLGALFLAAAWVGWFVASRVSGEPRPDWSPVERLNELVASRQPDGADAWPIYERVLREDLGIEDMLERLGNEHYEELIHWRANQLPLAGHWSDPVWSAERERFDRLRFLLDRLDDAAAAPGFAKPYAHYEDEYAQNTPAVLILLPELEVFRPLARLNAVGLRAASESGDWDEVVRRFRAGQAMGRHLSLQPALVEWTISVSVISIVQDELIQILMERRVPEPVCEALLDALDELRWPALPLERVFDGVRIQLEDLLQRMYTPGDRGFVVEWAKLDYFSLYVVDFNRVRPPFSRPSFFTRLENLAHMDLSEPRRRRAEQMVDDVMDLLESSMQTGEDRFIVDRRTIRERVSGSGVLENFMPDYHLTPVNIGAAVSSQEALRVMLRLELHHNRTGTWPASLEEAMEPSLTLDPMTGAPFQYQRVLDDADGRPYILRAPVTAPRPQRRPHWPELNPARPPIPDAIREAWEAEQEVGGASDQ